MKNKDFLTSDGKLFDKYKKLEILGFCIVVIGGIIAALSGLFRFRGGNYYNIFISLIISGLIIVVIGFILFIIYYLKLRKMRNQNGN